MTWFKVDDTLHSHTKVMRAGVEAMGLWICAGSWSAGHLTNGWVPDYAVMRWASNGRELAARLVAAGLWTEGDHDGDTGFWFHQWEERNPTRDAVVTRRQSDAERRARWRASKRGQRVTSPSSMESQRDSHEGSRRDSSPPAETAEPQQKSRRDTARDTDDVSRRESRQGSACPDPTRPDPSSKGEKDLSSRTATPQRDDVTELCTRLRDRMVSNGARASITEGWRQDARLMLDRDGRDLAEALDLIDWCQADQFWRSNILSMGKLRKQYDQLRLKATAERDPVGVTGWKPLHRDPHTGQAIDW